MKQFIMMISLLMAGRGFAGDAVDLSQEEFLKKVASSAEVVILDVRTVDEFEEGRVPKAVNIPHNSLKRRLDELAKAKDKEIVIYCRSGGRAGVAAKILSKAGFTKLFHLDGDMTAWVAEGQKIEK